MKLEKKNLIVERPYKSVYKTEEGIVKNILQQIIRSQRYLMKH